MAISIWSKKVPGPENEEFDYLISFGLFCIWRFLCLHLYNQWEVLGQIWLSGKVWAYFYSRTFWKKIAKVGNRAKTFSHFVKKRRPFQVFFINVLEYREALRLIRESISWTRSHWLKMRAKNHELQFSQKLVKRSNFTLYFLRLLKNKNIL